MPPLPLAVSALLIFALRVTDMSLDTLRVVSMVRGQKLLAALFGAAEAFVFIAAIAQVLAGKVYLLQMAGYALGFGTGTWLGMVLSQKFAAQYLLIRVISREHGRAIAERLRNADYRVTVVTGEGRNGPVPILFTVVRRSNGNKVLDTVRTVDGQALVTSDTLDHATGGFIPRHTNLLASVRH